MNNRWIDQYFLRYAVGTVVGAAIVAYLSTRLPPSLRIVIPHFDTWGKIVALTATGLAFCYIASAPLLVCHVGRCLLVSVQNEKRRIGLFATIATFLMMFGIAWLVTGREVWKSFSLAAILGLFFAQLIIIFSIHRERDSIFKFYHNLARARKGADHDIVESYRGIREHANAYSIVSLEVLLGIILAGLIEESRIVANLPIFFGTFLTLAGVWVIPSTFILSAAARIETDFVDDYVKNSPLPSAQPPSGAK